jgi:hypothetical protein
VLLTHNPGEDIMTAEVYTRIKTLIESNDVWKITESMLDLAKEVSTKLQPIEEVKPILFTEKIVFQTKKASDPIIVELGLENSKVNDSEVSHENTIDTIEKVIG